MPDQENANETTIAGARLQTDMHVLVAGAGIGGLTAALSLEKLGIEVTVFESARTIAPLGVGINILPHAARELIALGLKDDLDRIAVRTRSMKYFTRRGKLALSVPCGEYAGYSWPQYSVHRGELQLLLLETFRRRAGAHRVVAGHELAGFRQDGDSITASFIDPSSKQPAAEVTGDVLIGADGLHSATRKALYPDEGAAVYAGMVCFRGALKAAPFLDGESMVICGDNRLRLVSYPISGVMQRNGDSHINWIAAVPFQTDKRQEEDWGKLTRPDNLVELYRDWRFDWLDVPGIISATEQIFEFPIYDRDPLRQWTFDRVTLLGDAAHPLIPVSSSGAVHAVIDGRALAHALATRRDPVDGLRAYEADRLPKANRVVLASRENGPDEVLEIVRNECPDDAENIHDHVSEARLQSVIDEFKARSGFAVDTLNNSPSYAL